jgi:type IV secretion system protein VirB9
MIAKLVPAKAGIALPLPARSRRSPGGIAPGLAATGTALLLALSALLIPSQGWALEKTSPSKEDARVRSVVYQPGNVVPLKSPMGSSLMVVFAPDEHIVKVAVSDEARLSTDVIKDRNSRLANFLFLKAHPVKGDPPGYVLPPEPLQVVTQRGAGALRYYQFEFEAQPAGGDPDYTVRFAYPHDAWERRQAALRAARARRKREETEALLRHETDFSGSTGGYSGLRNYAYEARGNPALAPRWVWDTGANTYFDFPALQHVPAVFRGRCGEHEATADFSVHSDMVVATGTEPVWCLRADRSALEIYNLAWNPEGATPATGTISPFVQRTLK